MSSGLRLCLIWNKWSVRVCKTEESNKVGRDRWMGRTEISQ